MQPLVIDDVRRFSDLVRSVEPEMNEADTEARLVLPLLRLLGWSEAGPAQIRRQVATHGLFADIHLILGGRPICVIEVKRRGIPLFIPGKNPRDGVLLALTKPGRDTFDQAVTYAVADGIPCAWITNGIEHLVFRVQQPWKPIESRVIMASTDLTATFDDLAKLAPSTLEALQLVDDVPPPSSASSDVFARLGNVCAVATNEQLGWLVDDLNEPRDRPLLKYAQSIFVPRERYEALFEEFWRGHVPVLLFSGEAGIGKTSLLCHLAMTLQQRLGQVPAIFLDAFHLGHGLHPAVHNVLRSFTSVAELRSLDAALDAIEEHVLARQPFAEVLRGAARRSDPSPASGLRVLFSRLSEARVRNGNASLQRLLSWLSEKTEHPDFAARLKWMMNAPLPREKPSILARGRQRYPDLDGYVQRLLERASTGAINFWEYTRNRGDATVLDLLNAIALLHASASSPVGDDVSLTDLEVIAWNTWLPAAAAMLIEARPADLLAAPANVRLELVRLLSLTNVEKLLVIVDAINESPQPGRLRGEIVEIARLFQGRLGKLVLSCRTPDLPFFESEAFRALRFRPDDPSTMLDRFGLTEFAAAWQRYRDVYGIRGTPGPALRELCMQPLILRIMCEAYAGGAVPADDIRLIEIFDGYWRRKVEGAPDGGARAIVLQRLADLALRLAGERDDGEGNVIPLVHCEGLLQNGKAVFDSLISEAVLVFLAPTASGDAGVRFMYESFHEYVLARNIRASEPLLNKPEAVISGVLRRCKHERLMRGTLTYLLLWLDQHAVDVSAWLRAMFEAGLVSEAVTTASKLRVRESTTRFARWLQTQKLSNDQMFTIARAIAKHVAALDRGPYGDCLAAALRDPNRALLAYPVGLAILEGERPRIDPDDAAYVLGFDRLWCAATGTQPPLAGEERDLLQGSGRAARIESIAGVLQRNADSSWLRLLDVAADLSATQVELRRAVAETIRQMIHGRTSSELAPRTALTVRQWLSELAGRDAGQSFIRRTLQTLAQLLVRPREGGRTARISTVLDLVSDDAGALSFVGVAGDVGETLFVARLVRLMERCRDFACTRSSRGAITERMIAAMAVGLYEIADLLVRDGDASGVVLWLVDVAKPIREEPVTVRQFLDISDRDRVARAIWKEMIRTASRLAANVPYTHAGWLPRRQRIR